ncbi:hypothetical protein [Pseudomonas syringae]|uniref:hypothetical protein n=1 Tax=Pseudomonas syringae TaxID=317 RepID=UPI001F1179E3|nr:hypothetical protein [Pseudomonas syringae]MCH5568799.1 hypothetical protein [Pseudomonas syringae pv. syringae]
MTESYSNGMCLAVLLNEMPHVDSLESTNINFIGSFNDAYFNQVDNAINDLAFYSAGTALYECVQANMAELLDAVVFFAKRYMDEGTMTDEHMDEAAFSFSRLSLNLLGMFKSFIDHGISALSRRFGDNSNELAQWKAKLSQEYDASAAYRLFSNLRNYCQHVGMPPLHFSISETQGEDGVRVILEFHANELLETYHSWSKDARIDLENGPPAIVFIDNLQEWSLSFNRLAAWIDEIRRQAVLDAALCVASIRERSGLGPEGRIVIAPTPQENSAGDGLNLSLRNIPEERAKAILKGQKSFGL